MPERQDQQGGAGPFFQFALFALATIGAFILRIAYLKPLRWQPLFDIPHRDSIAYVERAKEILGGDLLGAGVSFHSAPIYPFFLAAIMGPGGLEGLWWVRVVQALLSAMTVGFLGLAALRLFGRGAAIATAVLSACYAPFLFYSGELLEIMLTLFLLSLLAWILAAKRQGILSMITAGLCLGLACLGKPNLLLLAPVVLIFLGFLRPLRAPRNWPWRNGILFAVGMLVVILPFTLRNKIAGDDWVLISSNGGINLFIGNNPSATGGFAVPASFEENLETASQTFASTAEGRELKPSEVSRFWTGRAMQYFKLYPGEALKNFAFKAGLLVGHYEIPNHFNIYFFRDTFSPLLGRLAWLWLVLPFATIGLVAGARRSRETRFAAWSIVVVAVSVILFFVTSRYRIPMMIWLFPFAGFGVMHLWRCLRGGDWPRVFVSVIVAGLALVLLFLPLIPAQDFNQSWVTLGNYWATLGDWDKVALYNQQALRVSEMRSASAWQNLGYAYYQLSRSESDLDRAEECLWKAISIDPYMGHAYGNLAALYYRLDRVLLLEPCVERAIELDPSLRSRLADIIDFLGPKRRDWQSRVETTRQRVETNLALDPDRLDFQLDKAFLLAMRLEDYDGAMDILRALPPDSMQANQELKARAVVLVDRIERAKRYTPLLERPLPASGGGFNSSSR